MEKARPLNNAPLLFSQVFVKWIVYCVPEDQDYVSCKDTLVLTLQHDPELAKNVLKFGANLLDYWLHLFGVELIHILAETLLVDHLQLLLSLI